VTTPCYCRVFGDPAALARAAAEAFVHSCREAILSRGRFVVALSGGSTPKALHHLLAAHPYRDYVEWDRVHFLFGDERFVPPNDDQSNENMARSTLLDFVPTPASQIHGMYADMSAEDAATRYETLVRSLLGEEGRIDLTLLGLGPDGHTASLFPGRPTVHVTDKWVVAAQANVGVGERITMTVPLLNHSRQVMFLVAGADKAPALKRVLTGVENWDETPAQAVARHGDNVHFLVDAAAQAG